MRDDRGGKPPVLGIVSAQAPGNVSPPSSVLSLERRVGGGVGGDDSRNSAVGHYPGHVVHGPQGEIRGNLDEHRLLVSGSVFGGFLHRRDHGFELVPVLKLPEPRGVGRADVHREVGRPVPEPGADLRVLPRSVPVARVGVYPEVYPDGKVQGAVPEEIAVDGLHPRAVETQGVDAHPGRRHELSRPGISPLWPLHHRADLDPGETYRVKGPHRPGALVPARAHHEGIFERHSGDRDGEPFVPDPSSRSEFQETEPEGRAFAEAHELPRVHVPGFGVEAVENRSYESLVDHGGKNLPESGGRRASGRGKTQTLNRKNITSPSCTS